MFRLLSVAAHLVSFFVPMAKFASAPRVSLRSASIHAEFYLPDASAGYYRGTRFDWAGVISSLTWNRHSYFGEWFDRYDPMRNDAVTGPAEEFSSVGYDDARVGEPFVRIGVGAVRKPDEPSYQKYRTYEIVDPGTRGLRRGENWLEFSHRLGSTRGYAYDYAKKLLLEGDTLVVQHRLTNTGRNPIVTTVYGHNFFMLDNEPTGPDIVVRFPFAVRAEAGPDPVIETSGGELRYLRMVGKSEFVHADLSGFGPRATDHDIRLENRKTGAAVRQTSDRPMSKLVLWSPATTVCPEAFVNISVEPGKTETWEIAYTFYEAAKAPLSHS